MAKLKIGTLELNNRVIAAPMAGVSDKAYRQIAAGMGCGLVFTEMISDMGLIYGQKKTGYIADTQGETGPVGVQVFGSRPQDVARGARILAERGAALIDINMGCPTPKVVKNDGGAALLNDLPRAREMLRAVRDAVSVPLTVKMRKGWEDEDESCLELAQIAQEEGVNAIALHPRSRRQFFTGHADWDMIRRVKAVVSIPVIGNGDIHNAADGQRMMEETGCDAVMIGRGALGNPFIFRETAALLERGELLPPPEPEERIATARRHLSLAVKQQPEEVAVREMRKHISWYIKGMRAAAKMREQINRATTARDMNALLDQAMILMG
ncbi:MAG: tRNA dihydrouridine synthase DusB [Syntrophomonadaceae bacterium]|nr:tRNA dihydrouridine synthase DusB [Syntrophomonadaceae bacterium]